MPAIETEVEEAYREGVRFEFLVAPVRIEREGEVVRSVTLQRMKLDEADASGRRSPRPIEGSYLEVSASSIISAVAQEPDWTGLRELVDSEDTPRPAHAGAIADGVWIGGDAVTSGIAGMAIAQGRHAAEAVHARLRDLPPPVTEVSNLPLPANAVKLDYYEPRPSVTRPELPIEERLAQPDRETHLTIDESDFIAEAGRCLSCGLCFGCEHCWTYCNAGAYTRLSEARPGTYFALTLDKCEGCRKCIEVCPCGYVGVAAQ
jgi:formate dehydrogenase major subunit